MNHTTLSLDRFTRCILAALTALLTIIAVELYVGLPERGLVHAQIPDTGLQRQQIVEEARRTNTLLEQILAHLRTGSVKVKVESADKAEGRKGRSAP